MVCVTIVSILSIGGIETVDYSLDTSRAIDEKGCRVVTASPSYGAEFPKTVDVV